MNTSLSGTSNRLYMYNKLFFTKVLGSHFSVSFLTHQVFFLHYAFHHLRLINIWRCTFVKYKYKNMNLISLTFEIWSYLGRSRTTDKYIFDVRFLKEQKVRVDTCIYFCNYFNISDFVYIHIYKKTFCKQQEYISFEMNDIDILIKSFLWIQSFLVKLSFSTLVYTSDLRIHIKAEF